MRWLAIPCPLLALVSCGALAFPPAALSPVTVAGLQKWIQHARDNRGLPYLIIDKRQAHLWIYDGQGRSVEDSAVLLGSAVGDDSVEGVGDRPLARIPAHERTTPAGRFFLQVGLNLSGEDIFWIDYQAALSLHRVRPGQPGDQRLRRLASATVGDNRITYGCVNVPAAVYNRTVKALFASRGGYAYILPERKDLRRAFPFLTPLAQKPPGAEPGGGPASVHQFLSPRGGRAVVPSFMLPAP